MDDLHVVFIPTAINPRKCVRIKAKNGFKIHLSIYVAINAMFVVVWALTRGYVWFFWPIFSIVGWGVGVFANWYEVYHGTITEDQIQRELKNRHDCGYRAHRRVTRAEIRGASRSLLDRRNSS